MVENYAIAYDIQNLTKTYPQHSQPANDNICLQIYAGEIFGILVDNGASEKHYLVRLALKLSLI